MKAKLRSATGPMKLTLSIQEAYIVRQALAAGTNLYNAAPEVKEFLEVLKEAQEWVDAAEVI